MGQALDRGVLALWVYNPVDTNGVFSRLIIIQSLACHALECVNVIGIVLLLAPGCSVMKHLIALAFDHIQQIETFCWRNRLFKLVRAHELRSLVQDLVS